ncbi:MAG: xanthine dehydrogenase family protein subunit M, partial [Candidatus Marinimicrobia bacterium]|nr:xanthine dehydrogenase family protein subunit M [Candidatus Neomarinimicrobiota bacterium]
KGELLTEIWIKIPSFTHYYRKFGPRKALALSKVSFCGVHLADSDEIRLAYGSVGPTVIRAYEAEELYKKGQKDKIPDLINKLVQPINDQRSTAEYRRYLCVEMTREFLNELCKNSC